ncbi:MAG: PQQ-like beta-propeller repeat protein, partial [Phycisphaeraceae bacterium]|nr:PQQ-like beta-propeller repeat protein [Phycisphaeraceae bacterium]
FASEHPAAAPDDAAMMARRLTALSRAEQWKAFDALAEYARFRHPQTTIQVAGRDTEMASLITGLITARGEQPAQPDGASPMRLAMPQAGDFEYDRDMIAKDHFALLRQQAMNNNMASILDQAIAPAVAADGDRLFTLALGSVARLDPQTGTDLWRVGDPDETVQKLASRMYNLTGGFHQSLVVHNDTLLATLPGKVRDLNTYLVAMDAKSGEVRWSVYDMLRSKNEGVVGEPLVIDDLAYFVTYRSSLELTLRAVRLSNGSEAGKLALGKASKGPNVNAPAELSPRLTMGQSHLLVQTNNGALIAVDPNNMSIAWAFTQKIRQSGINMMRRHGYAVANATARHTGDVVAKDGLVIAKDTRTNRVVAFREYDAAMVWTADSDADATIVHQDSKHVYVLGKELVALDLRTGERVWWTPHAGEQSGQPVFTQDACLIAGNQRLCRIDLSTGKLTHFREDLSSPAALHVVGNQLISVGPKRIAAVRLP